MSARPVVGVVCCSRPVGEEIAQRLDSLLPIGSPSNVEPARYAQDDASAGPFDPGRTR